jgi:hypothetical protein
MTQTAFCLIVVACTLLPMTHKIPRAPWIGWHNIQYRFFTFYLTIDYRIGSGHVKYKLI